jgi:hypothetical protein
MLHTVNERIATHSIPARRDYDDCQTINMTHGRPLRA